MNTARLSLLLFSSSVVLSCGSSGYYVPDYGQISIDKDVEQYDGALAHFDRGENLAERFKAIVEADQLATSYSYIDASHGERYNDFQIEVEAVFLAAERSGRFATATTTAAMLVYFSEGTLDPKSLLEVADQDVPPGAAILDRARQLVARASINLGSLVYNEVMGQRVESQHIEAQLGGLFQAANLSLGNTRGRAEVTAAVLDAGGREFEFVLDEYFLENSNEGQLERTRTVDSPEYQYELTKWRTASGLYYNDSAIRDRISEISEIYGGMSTTSGGHYQNEVSIDWIDGELYWVEQPVWVSDGPTVFHDSPITVEIKPGFEDEYDRLQDEIVALENKRDRELGPRPSNQETYYVAQRDGVITRAVSLRRANGSNAVSGELELTANLTANRDYDDFWFNHEFGDDFRDLTQSWLPKALAITKQERYESLVAESRPSWTEQQAAEELLMRDYLFGVEALMGITPMPTGGTSRMAANQSGKVQIEGIPIGCRIEIPALEIDVLSERATWEQGVYQAGDYFMVLSSQGKQLRKIVSLMGDTTNRVQVDFAAGTIVNLDAPGDYAAHTTPKGTGWHGEQLPDRMRKATEYEVYFWDTGRGFDIEMVYVPAGDFLMGADADQHTHPIAKGYFIGRYETTWWEIENYRSQTGAEGHTGTDEMSPEDPVVYITWEQSVAYCEWVGLSLPTEAQWEKAARGTKGQAYPWGGIEPVLGAPRANGAGNDAPIAGGQFRRFASPFGAFDMAGNVMEWCADIYDGEVYERYKKGDFQVPTEGRTRVLRGGSYAKPNSWMLCAARYHNDSYWSDTGFRPAL